MEYIIDKRTFAKTFLDSNNNCFSHKTNNKYKLFPFTGSTSDKTVDNFDNILGAFLRNLYSLNAPKGINMEDIISNMCSEVEFNNNTTNIVAFKQTVKDMYFINQNQLKSASINTFKYSPSTKNEMKISKYIVSALCNKNKIIEILEQKSNTNTNLLDILLENNLPILTQSNDSEDYVSLIPQISEIFNKDLIFLLEDSGSDFSDIIQLISYYYFFYTSQVILNIELFAKSNMQVEKVYFCMSWEKSSRGRLCFTDGWIKINSLLNSMFSHAVLLEMLNQTDRNERYGYKELCSIYNSMSHENKDIMFNSIKNLKDIYTTEYAKPDGFTYKEDDYIDGDLEGLIKCFYRNIKYQFEKTTRHRARDAYKNSFYEFCRSNFLQNRKTNGLMLALNEEQLVLLTKVIIGKQQQMRLNELFSEFENRGVFMDKNTKICVVEFYEKLNLIEKKSDSGDAQYVKGIL